MKLFGNVDSNRNKYNIGIALLKTGAGSAIYDPVNLSIVRINELCGKEKWVSGAVQHSFEDACLFRTVYQES